MLFDDDGAGSSCCGAYEDDNSDGDDDGDDVYVISSAVWYSRQFFICVLLWFVHLSLVSQWFMYGVLCLQYKSVEVVEFFRGLDR